MAFKFELEWRIGKYPIIREIGRGATSRVYLAQDPATEREVAVKLLAEHLAEDPTFVSRFQREALAAARLVHPNIVQVFDSGLDEASGRHYIVMEYVDGRSCAQLLRDRGHLEVQDAIFVVEQACKGLEYAHRNGVVHRDVKPGNLLVSRDGTVKLADFGIAKATEQSSITQVGSVLGTAAYLAPEQARGEEAGPATDLYSLGVVTYQLLSGRLPSLVHGVHGLLAYGVFVSYLMTIYQPGVNFWSYLSDTPTLCVVLFAVLLGGMTTGHRGFGEPIGAFSWPQRAPQVVMIIHLFAALMAVAALGSTMPDYPVAFYLAVAQVVVGFLLFHAVNLKPRTPGVLVAVHQSVVLAITVAIVAA